MLNENIEEEQFEEYYLVSEYDWEYNDEYYYRPESEGSCPIKLYMSYAKAEQAKNELTHKKFLDLIYYNKYESIDGYINDRNFDLDIINRLINKSVKDCWELAEVLKSIPAEFWTSEIIEKVLPEMGLYFYRINKIRLE